MSLTSVAAMAVAGIATVTSLVVGAGTASADSTTTLGGFCYNTPSQDGTFRYSVLAVASPIPVSSWKVDLTFQKDIRYADGSYHMVGGTTSRTVYFTGLSSNSICLNIDSGYGVANGRFVP